MGSLDKGAPIDVQWLNDLSEKVDRLIAASNSSPYQQSSINNTLFDASGMRIMKTAETRIHAETQSMTQAKYAADTVVPFSVALTNFAQPPVATATPVVINPTAEKVGVFAVVTSVTASAVAGYLYLKTGVSAGVTLGVSIVAIGVPSNSPGTASTNIQANKFFTSQPTAITN